MKPVKSMPKKRTYLDMYRRYLWGLVIALSLVYIAYFVAVQQLATGATLAGILIAVGVAQFGVQMKVFLHVGEEEKPRWTLVSIIYTVAMLLIIVVGSLWIMANMNYNMHMSPEQIKDYMIEQNKKGF